jgi:hypothetical protein
VEHPVPGNHEYEGAPQRDTAPGYYSYFGAAAGDPAKGYYRWDLADWTLLALNSSAAGLHAHARRPPRRLLAGVLRGGQPTRRVAARGAGGGTGAALRARLLASAAAELEIWRRASAAPLHANTGPPLTATLRTDVFGVPSSRFITEGGAAIDAASGTC